MVAEAQQSYSTPLAPVANLFLSLDLASDAADCLG